MMPETGPGVMRRLRVNSINPGGVEIALRLGQPGDIASVAVFLASAASGWAAAKGPQ